MGFLRLRFGNGGSVAGRVLCYDTLIERWCVARGRRRGGAREKGRKLGRNTALTSTLGWVLGLMDGYLCCHGGQQEYNGGDDPYLHLAEKARGLCIMLQRLSRVVVVVVVVVSLRRARGRPLSSNYSRGRWMQHIEKLHVWNGVLIIIVTFFNSRENMKQRRKLIWYQISEKSVAYLFSGFSPALLFPHNSWPVARLVQGGDFLLKKIMLNIEKLPTLAMGKNIDWTVNIIVVVTGGIMDY